MIDYKETDLNYSVALNAHRGTSFTPNIRAKQEIEQYMAEMQNVSERFEVFATPENKEELKAALENYRQGYLKHLNIKLQAQSNVLSAMITGPSNFPTRRNKKKNDILDRRIQEFLEWREKALNRLNKNFNPVAIARQPIRSDEVDAIEQLEKKIAQLEENQRIMKEVNKIVRNKKLDQQSKVEAIKELNVSDELLNYMRRSGEGKFPSFRLTNNNANIRRLKGRLIVLQAEAEREEVEDKETTILGEAVTIVENKADVRLQLFFNGKPPHRVIDLLKRNAFKWSRKNSAWQRLLNANSRRALEGLVDTPV
jgi:hypothetical protein